MSKKILFLEDEEVLGSIYKKNLEKEGYEVKWVQTSKEIEDQAKIFPADILILDHGLQEEEISGIDLIPLLRKYLPKADIFILSNYSHFEFQQTLKDKGIKGYFVKIDTPPKILIEKIQTLTGKDDNKLRSMR